MSNKLAEMARRFKQEKEAAQSLRQVYLPKLNDTKVFQRDLKLRIDEMKEDTALLPEMFRNERDEKKRILTEFTKQKDEMERAKKEDAYLRKQVRDLTAEVERKKRLAMQAIAARGQFKDSLNEY